MIQFDEKREAILATLESMTYAQWSNCALIGTCESCKYWERWFSEDCGHCGNGVDFGRGEIGDCHIIDGCNLWEQK